MKLKDKTLEDLTILGHIHSQKIPPAYKGRVKEIKETDLISKQEVRDWAIAKVKELDKKFEEYSDEMTESLISHLKTPRSVLRMANEETWALKVTKGWIMHNFNLTEEDLE